MFEYFNGFWNWALNNPEKNNPTATAIYFYILNVANELRWKESFGLSSTQIISAVGVSNYKTYKKNLDVLVENGLIKIVVQSKNQYQCNIFGLVKFTEASPKQNQSKPEAKKKQSESNAHNHKTIKEDIDNINNKDFFAENENQVSKSSNLGLHNWFVKASPEEFTERINKFKEEHPNSGYPEILYKDFINYYSTPHKDGGIELNHQRNFGIQNKLQQWIGNTQNAGKYEIKSPSKSKIYYE
jgi:predicted transcriptional regulator